MIIITEKLYQDKEWLKDQYWNKKESSETIAQMFNLTRQGIIYWLKKHNIKIRTKTESQKLALEKERTSIHGFNIKPFAPKREKSHKWKGEKASYNTIHASVRELKGKPQNCEKCGKINCRIELSFNHHNEKPTRNLEDYKYLCSSCHIKRDYEEFGISGYRGW